LSCGFAHKFFLHNCEFSAMVAFTLEIIAEIIAGLIAFFVIGEIGIRIITKGAKRAKISKPVIRNIREAVTAIWIAISLAWVFQILGLTTLLTSLTISGIIGLAISLGLQTTISNVIAGIFLLQDNALHTGDTIAIGTVKGEVVKLGLRNTWLKSSEGEIVIISNATLSAGPFTNYTAKERLNKKLEKDL
jgi:small-conductance mechanosensitive channel